MPFSRPANTDADLYAERMRYIASKTEHPLKRAEALDWLYAHRLVVSVGNETHRGLYLARLRFAPTQEQNDQLVAAGWEPFFADDNGLWAHAVSD